MSIQQLLQQQVCASPDAIAVQYGDDHVTYERFNRAVNQAALELSQHGAAPEVRIGLCLTRSIELVIGVWAILKSGGAFVPLEPGDSTDRLAYVASDARVTAVVSHSGLATRLADAGRPVLAIDAAIRRSEHDVVNPPVRVTPTNLAYVIYTSGSTGRPKGAMNTHAGLFNRITWMQQTYPLGADDRVMQKTPFSFDVSVWEFIWPLVAGASLVVAQPSAHRDPEYVGKTILREQVTTVHFVPSMLDAFLALSANARCTSLRRVICSGEALPPHLVTRFFDALNAELHNLYGPTEAAIDVSAWPCVCGEQTPTRIPIGRAISNTNLYVLERDLQIAGDCVEGDLFIAGVALARGYAGRPAATAASFVPNPFADKAGARMYRTGDRASRRPDGALEFLGRADRQVKLRGVRIELGEIEAVVSEQPSVRHCAAVIREYAPGDQRLVVYVVLHDTDEANLRPLWAFLSERLPREMMPGAIVALDHLPTTAHGKLDVAALDPRVQVRGDGERPYVAARTPLERVIAEQWWSVLGTERVGVLDNFFELGGHSLLASQLVVQLQDRFPTKTSLMAAFFQEPTVAGMARFIESESTAAPAVDGDLVCSAVQEE